VWVERLTISNHPPLLKRTRTHVASTFRQPTSEIVDGLLRFTPLPAKCGMRRIARGERMHWEGCCRVRVWNEFLYFVGFDSA
jgi:hypothetical protein